MTCPTITTGSATGSRRRLALDLFCGAGLVADGLKVAGWDVVGVDLHPQPHYPGPFILADALSLDPRFVAMFDAIWASPPCLRDTIMRHAKGAKGDAHPELIIPTRTFLKASGKPYVLENVPTARLHDPVRLNGFMFNLGANTSDGQRWHLERARHFEANWPLWSPSHWRAAEPVIGIYGAHVRNRSAAFGGRKTADFPGEDKPKLMHEAMGLSRRLTMAEISQGIPPAYAAWVGERLLDHLASRA